MWCYVMSEIIIPVLLQEALVISPAARMYCTVVLCNVRDHHTCVTSRRLWLLVQLHECTALWCYVMSEIIMCYSKRPWLLVQLHECTALWCYVISEIIIHVLLQEALVISPAARMYCTVVLCNVRDHHTCVTPGGSGY